MPSPMLKAVVEAVDSVLPNVPELLGKYMPGFYDLCPTMKDGAVTATSWRTPTEWETYAQDTIGQLPWRGTPVAKHVFHDGPNKFLQDWPGMTPEWPVIITVAYLLTIFFGVKIMANFKAVQMKWLPLIHNLFLSVLSLWMTVEILVSAYYNFNWENGGMWFCNPVDTEGPRGKRMAFALYIHYISKAYELIDTCIMVLKKNNKQITFLHVYHHSTTFFPTWYFNAKYGPGGEAYFCGALNSLVHVFMYSHYAAATLKLSTPWKFWITKMQIIQFVLYLVQVGWMQTYDCYHPRISVWLLTVQAIVFLALFINFYTQAQKPRPKAKKEE